MAGGAASVAPPPFSLPLAASSPRRLRRQRARRRDRPRKGRRRGDPQRGARAGADLRRCLHAWTGRCCAARSAPSGASSAPRSRKYVDALTKAIRGLGGETDAEAAELEFSRVDRTRPTSSPSPTNWRAPRSPSTSKRRRALYTRGAAHPRRLARRRPRPAPGRPAAGARRRARPTRCPRPSTAAKCRPRVAYGRRGEG